MFRVVRIAQSMGSDVKREITKVDGIDTKESALILAEVACSEHADGIYVSYRPYGTDGFTFTTSNGTVVTYAVRKA